MNYFLWSVGKMQWFLKQGHEHPLEAIGYVAAANRLLHRCGGARAVGLTSHHPRFANARKSGAAVPRCISSRSSEGGALPVQIDRMVWAWPRR
jgi:hypothetical protein